MIKETYKTKIKEMSLNVTDGKISAIREKNITKTGLRVYKDKKIGIAGTIGNYNEDILLNKAVESLRNCIPYESEPSQNYKEHIVNESNLPEGKEALGFFEKILKKLRDDNKEFIFNGKIKVYTNRDSIQNDKNLDLLHERKGVSINLQVRERFSPKISDLDLKFETSNFFQNEFIDYANKKLTAYKNKILLPNKKLPVVFLNNDFGLLLKFWDLNGEMFGSGASIFSKNIDEKMFSKDLTLYDSRNPMESNKAFFDMEGVVNKDYRYELIQNGVIKSPFTDKEISRRYDLPRTGGAACDYDGVPGIFDWPNFIIKPGCKSIKELLGGDLGILIDVAVGGDFTPSGIFGTPVQVAYLIDGENIIGWLPELKLSGDLFEFFGKGFRGVSRERVTPSCREHYMVMDMEVSLL